MFAPLMPSGLVIRAPFSLLVQTGGSGERGSKLISEAQRSIFELT